MPALSSAVGSEAAVLKLWALLKRDANRLDPEAFRAAHVGHHASMLRRLKGLRGYCVDLRPYHPLAERLGPLYGEVVWTEPAAVTASWDGLSTLYFDDRASLALALTPERTRATADGLSVDPDWCAEDARYLFDGAGAGSGWPVHRQVEEHRLVAVERPERKLTKVLLFFRRHPAQSESALRSALLGRHAELVMAMAGLRGCTLNLRLPDRATAVFGVAEGDSVLDPAPVWSLWDGVLEFYFDSIEAFRAARSDLGLHPELTALQRHLFEAVWYVEVDENVIVMPNRERAPAVYYR